MFLIIMIFASIFFGMMSFLSWEQGAKGWWVWAVLFAITSFVYWDGIHS